jgi:hypothetical protein
MNFKKDDDFIAFSSQMLNGFKLYGEFTDAGYRFRSNTYTRIDKWWWPLEAESSFFDLVPFNHYPFSLTPEEIKDSVIAELYFRLDTNLMEHEKTVYSFTDFLDSLAGMMDFLFQLAVAIFGGYVFYSQDSQRCLDLYAEGKTTVRKKVDDLGFCFYFANYSSFSCCLRCCGTTRNAKSMVKKIDDM